MSFPGPEAGVAEDSGKAETAAVAASGPWITFPFHLLTVFYKDVSEVCQ